MQTGNPFFILLDTVGDGSGTTNAVGNYLGAPQIFKTVVPVDEKYFIDHLHVQLSDVGGFTQSGYGSAVALTNGFNLFYYLNGVQYTLLPEVIKQNDHFIHYGFDYTLTAFSAGNDTSDGKLNFPALLGLDGNHDDYIYVELSDDFTGLIDHTFLICGYK